MGGRKRSEGTVRPLPPDGTHISRPLSAPGGCCPPIQGKMHRKKRRNLKNKERKSVGHSLVNGGPAVFVALGCQETRVAVVGDMGDVMALGRHLPQRAAVAERQPVHLAAGQRQPQRNAVGVPPHLQAAAVAARQTRQLAVASVREVVEVVARDQVLGVHVGTVLSWTKRQRERKRKKKKEIRRRGSRVTLFYSRSNVP